jgi:hypothetical protein
MKMAATLPVRGTAKNQPCIRTEGSSPGAENRKNANCTAHAPVESNLVYWRSGFKRRHEDGVVECQPAYQKEAQQGRNWALIQGISTPPTLDGAAKLKSVS